MKRETFYLVVAWWVALFVACCSCVVLEVRDRTAPARVSPVRLTPVPDACEAYRDRIEELEYRLFWFQQTHCGELPETVVCGGGAVTDEVEDEERVARETPYIPPN